jgi:hypothetical protein
MTGVQRRFVLRIDYRQSVSQMLAVPGFDELDDYLADPTRYSVHGTGVCTVGAVLFRPAVGRAKAAEIASDLAELGFMPARTEHLLAFARDYPKEHAGDDPITATDAMVFNGADKPAVSSPSVAISGLTSPHVALAKTAQTGTSTG